MDTNDRKETVHKLIRLKRFRMLLLLPLAMILMEIAKRSVYFTEFIYARGFFHLYSQVLSSITGLLPFSLAEIAILSGLLIVPAVIVWRMVVYVRSKGQRIFLLLRDVITLFCIASLVYFMLVLGCSLNYYRQTMAEYMEFHVRDSSAEELYALCEELIERTNAVREELQFEDTDGVYRLTMSKKELAAACDEAYDSLAEEYSIFHGIYPKPKRILLSSIMSRTELTGVYVPFTMEANVNIDIPDYSIASTMCHELAHLRGFIREDEANYISYLACTASEDKNVQYSGLMEALILTGNALYEINPDLWAESRSSYSEAVVRDLKANNDYWAQFHNTKISNTTEKLNDSYLKANEQEDGVQSYGRMVDLLLAEYRKKHGLD